MTVFSIKLLAMLSMIVDHLGYWLHMNQHISYTLFIAMRSFGRLAFPLFCFLIVNGYEHSSDRKKYLTRLIGFAAISQIPYTLVFSQLTNTVGAPGFALPGAGYILLCLFVGLVWYRYVRADFSALLAPLALLVGLSRLNIGGICLLQPDMNVFYTLALALAIICLADRLPSKEAPRAENIALALALLAAFILVWDRADYGINGLLLIILLWLFRARLSQQILMCLIWASLQYTPVSNPWGYYLCACASVLPMAAYNGKLGKPLKTAFYLVYPLHLLVLGIAGI